MNRRLTLGTLFVLILSAAAISGAVAATPGISGRLVDDSGQPVVGAWVAVIETNAGTQTDSTGSFSIPVPEPGTYHLVVVHSRFGTIRDLPSLTVSVSGKTRQDITINLPKAEAERNELVHGPSIARTDEEVRQQVADQSSDRDPRSGEKVVNEGIEAQSSGKGYIFGANDAYQGFSRVEKDKKAGSPDPGIREGGCVIPPPPHPFESPLPFDMNFQDYGTNGFTSTQHDRFSTFAADVDDASYTLIRQYLLDGNLPPTDAVRVEEFINHFDYGYNNPSDSKFRIFTEMTESPFDPQTVMMKIGVKGRELSQKNRRPMNLSLVVDISGSMNYGNRIQVVRDALNLLVNQLGGNDRVGIVAYNTHARVVSEPIPASERSALKRAINSLFCGGSTNAEAGLTLGYEMANRQYVSGHNNIVVLISDGVANVGQTGADGIMGRIERFARQGITLSSFGVGMGNYNDVLLEQLAQKGNGRYAYINDLDEARRVMVENFVANTLVLGRDVKVQVEFDPKQVGAYRLIGYENRAVADYRFRDNNQDGGEIGAGHEVTALYELKLKNARRTGKLADVYVRWTDFDELQVTEVHREVDMRNDYQRLGSSRPELRLAIAASRFAEKLKQTPYARSTGYDELLRVALDVQKDMSNDQTRELVQLIRIARDMSEYHTEWEPPYEKRIRGETWDGNYKR